MSRRRGLVPPESGYAKPRLRTARLWLGKPEQNIPADIAPTAPPSLPARPDRLQTAEWFESTSQWFLPSIFSVCHNKFKHIKSAARHSVKMVSQRALTGGFHDRNRHIWSRLFLGSRSRIPAFAGRRGRCLRLQRRAHAEPDL